jgi:hypothetical protein
MSSLIIGNIFGFIASIIMVSVGLFKTKKNILLGQVTNIGLFSISHYILGGITAVVVDAASITCNFLCYKGKLNNVAKIIIILFAFIGSLLVNNLDFIGILPAIGLAVNVKDIRKFKLLMIFLMSVWVFFDFTIKSYAACMFDLGTIITNIISLILIVKNRSLEKKVLN